MQPTTTKQAYATIGLTRTSRRKLIKKLVLEGVLDLAVIDAACVEMYGKALDAPTEKPPVPTRRSQFHFVYIFRANGLYKIGRSVDPEWRLKQMQTSIPYPLESVHIIKTSQHGLERALHRRFNDCKQREEWFALTEDDIQWIKEFGESLQ